MGKGTITRKDLIEDEALIWGPLYAKNLQKAIDKNNELKKSALELLAIQKGLNVVASSDELEKAQDEAAKASERATKAFRDQAKALAGVDEERTKQMRALLRVTNQRQNVNSKTNKQLIEQRELLKKETREIKTSMTFVGKLTALRDKARKSIQELSAKQALGIKLHDREQKELKQSQKEFAKYNKALVGIRKSTNQFFDNVGNYPKQLVAVGKAINSLLPALSILAILKGAFDFAKEAREFAIEAKGVEFAFEKIGDKGEAAFDKVKESTRGLLSDLDIKKSIVEFDNFNLNLEEMGSLMEFVSVRAAQTGKSFDYLKDSLVEGLSKESKLRIDNLGISATELNTELEKTPNFVEAVANIARKEIAEAGSILDDAANSQQQWNVAYENFQLQIGKGFIAKASNAFYSMGAAVLGAITPLKTLEEGVISQQTELQTLRLKIFNVNTSNEDRIRLINQLKTEYPGLLSNIDAETVSNEELEKVIKSVNDQLVNKILIAREEDKIAKQGEKTATARQRLLGSERQLRTAIVEGLKKAKDFKLDATKTDSENAQALLNYLDKQKQFNGQYKDINQAIFLGQRNVKVGQTLFNKEEEKSLELLNQKQQLLKDLGIDQKTDDSGNDVVTEEQLNKVKDYRDLITGLKAEQENLTENDKARGLEIKNQIKNYNQLIDTILGNSKKQSTDSKNLNKILKEDEINLAQFKLKLRISNEEAITKNANISGGVRLIAAKDSFDQSVLLLDLEKEKAISNAKGRKDELNRIQLAYNDDYRKLELKKQLDSEKILSDEFKKAKLRIEEKNKQEEKEFTDELLVLQEQLKNKEITIQQYENSLIKIKQDAAKEKIEAQISQVQTELLSSQLSFNQRKNLEEQLSLLRITLSQVTTDAILENAELEAESEEKRLEQRKKIEEQKKKIISEASENLANTLDLDAENLDRLITNIADGFEKGFTNVLDTIGAVTAVVGDVFNSISQSNIDEIDRQIEASEEYYAREIELAGDSEKKKKILEEQREKKRAQLEEKKKKEKTKQAKINKAASLVQAGINTALAITAALATVPFLPLGPTMATLAGVLGAVQIAAIAAKPIPKYYRGTSNHPGGLAEVAEYRPEVIEEPGKNPYLVKDRSFLDLPKKTKVYSSMDAYKKAKNVSLQNDFNSQNSRINQHELRKEDYSKIIRESGKNIEESVVKAVNRSLLKSKTTIVNNIELPTSYTKF